METYLSYLLGRKIGATTYQELVAGDMEGRIAAVTVIIIVTTTFVLGAAKIISFI